MDCTGDSISQHQFWPKCRDNILNQIKVCKTCQRNKKQVLKYGYLPAQEAKSIPWYRLLVDIIRPYNIRKEGHTNPLIMKALTMIYTGTGWF